MLKSKRLRICDGKARLPMVYLHEGQWGVNQYPACKQTGSLRWIYIASILCLDEQNGWNVQIK